MTQQQQKIFLGIGALLILGGGIITISQWQMNARRSPLEKPPGQEIQPPQGGTQVPGQSGTSTSPSENQRGITDLIRVDQPKPNDVAKSPLTLKGQARGQWFFEASFPVRLLDAKGTQIASGIAQAQGEWMTENFVPFEATLTFNAPSTDTGVLVFEKDNPSGLPQHAREFRMPVRFKEGVVSIQGECRPTGCSNQVCSDEDIITTCEYNPVYACYTSAKCERQKEGMCGWTQTEELKACIEKYSTHQ